MRGSPETTKSYGFAVFAAYSCTSGTFSSRSSAFRLPTSNDCTNTFAFLSFRWLRLSVRTSPGSSGSPIERKYVGCLVSG